MNGNGGSSFFGSDWLGAFLIIAILFGGGLWGGNRGPPENVATQEYVQSAINSQSIQSQLQQIALSSANNNYETARLIDSQTNAMLQQNNTNLINAIQGFNQVNLGIQNQTNVISQQLQALQAKMDTCCCEIKTQMLQQRLEDAQAQNVALQNERSNYQQSQYLLGQMGKWVANAPAAAAAV